jgi:hypothetical protein
MSKLRFGICSASAIFAQALKWLLPVISGRPQQLYMTDQFPQPAGAMQNRQTDVGSAGAPITLGDLGNPITGAVFVEFVLGRGLGSPTLPVSGVRILKNRPILDSNPCWLTIP